MDGPYADYILDASDCCVNCLRPIRVERHDPTRAGMIREYESHYERNPRTTEIAYGPADSASNAKGVFCDRCGTESSYDRVWDDEDVDDGRFRELVRQAIATLEFKEVSIQRHDFAAHALQERRDGSDVDEALAAATEAAIVAQAARSDRDEAQETQTT